MAIVTKEGDPVGVVGRRFCPTDEELVNFYLKRKNQGRDHEVRGMPVVNVCKFEPWDLPGQCKASSDDQCYFFSPRDYKYKNSKRSNRTTNAGFWKPTGPARKVRSEGREIGKKRTLVFHIGRSKGKGTEWVIHEYECAPDFNLQDQGNFVLCKLMKKSKEKTGEGELNHHIVLASDSQNQNPTEMATDSFRDEHQPPYHMAYDAENQCPNDVTATSTYANGDTSSRSMPPDIENQISMVTPDFEYQLPFMGGDSFRDEHQPPHHMAYDAENQCPNDMTATSTYANGDTSSRSMPPDIENQISMLTPDFEYQLPFMGGNFLSQNLPTCGEGGCPPMVIPTNSDWPFASDFKNQISACGEVLLPPTTMFFDLKNESPCLQGDRLMTSGYIKQISACGEGELPPSVISLEFRSELPYRSFTSDPKNQLLDIDFEEGAWNPPVRAPSEDCLNTCYLGNQISDVDSEEGQEISHILVPYIFGDQPTFNKGEPNSLLTYDFRKIKSDEKISISTSEEGESSPLKMTPSDFASQNQLQKIDVQNLEDVHSPFLMDFDMQSLTQC